MIRHAVLSRTEAGVAKAPIRPWGNSTGLRVKRSLPGPAIKRIVADIGFGDRVHAGFVNDKIARLIDQDRAIGLRQIAC